MLFLLKGLKTYLTDYFFVILLYITYSGVVDLTYTFYDLFVVDMGDFVRCTLPFDFARNQSGCNDSEMMVRELADNSEDWFDDRHSIARWPDPDQSIIDGEASSQNPKAPSTTELPSTQRYSSDKLCPLGSHNMITLTIRIPVAITIILLLSLFEKRQKMATNVCGGRPSFSIAVNLLDEHDNMIGYLCAFGLTANSALNLLSGMSFLDIDGLPSWTGVFMSGVNVLIVCILYHPFFDCLKQTNILLRSVLGLLYSTFKFVLFVVELRECPSNYNVTSEMEENYFWASNVLQFICCGIIWIRFLVFIFKELLSMYDNNHRKHKRKSIRDQSWGIYVRHILNKPRSNTVHIAEQSSGWLDKLKGSLYRPVPGFKYSRRMLGTLVVSILLIYKISVLEIPNLISTSNKIHTELKNLEFFTKHTDYGEDFVGFKQVADSLDSVFHISMGLSAVAVIYFMADTLCSYRRHLLRMFAGNKSFLPEKKSSCASSLVCYLKYSGYQIGFIFWAFMALQISIALVIIMIIYQIVIPIREGYNSNFIDQLSFVWPSCVFGGLIYLAQLAWAKYSFLQGEGKNMALDNRRMFHVTSFTMFYFNIILGLISCMSRLFRSLFFGLVYLGRLDRSVLQRDIELIDPGYRAYVGFLLVEEAHVHPVLLTFCNLLTDIQSEKEFKNQGLSLQSTFKSKRARNLWFVAYTLIRNPSLQNNRCKRRVADTTVNLWKQNALVRRITHRVGNENMPNISTITPVA
ncbi:stimulated by retinoic acid gene 6 protein-like [Glandiceps talaboti]